MAGEDTDAADIQRCCSIAAISGGSCLMPMQGQEAPWQDQGLHLMNQRKIELSMRMLQSLKAEKRHCKELKEATDTCMLAGET